MALEATVVSPMVPRALPRLPVQETAWPAQGKWTYEDYKRLPEDGHRYEIIEGVLYMIAAPNFDHQYTAGEVFTALRTYVRERQLGTVINAPFEVHLPGIARPVQPDVLFIAAGRAPRPGAENFTGAPDLIVEVISQSTARTDRLVKFSAYERAGVREYWLVDPRARSVEVYTLSAEGTYDMAGQYISGDTIKSTVLSDLVLPADDLFAVDQ